MNPKHQSPGGTPGSLRRMLAGVAVLVAFAGAPRQLRAEPG